MKVLIIILLTLLLVGCDEAMSASEIDLAIKECEKHNLTHYRLSSMLVDGGFSTTKIRCGGRRK